MEKELHLIHSGVETFSFKQMCIISYKAHTYNIHCPLNKLSLESTGRIFQQCKGQQVIQLWSKKNLQSHPAQSLASKLVFYVNQFPIE